MTVIAFPAPRMIWLDPCPSVETEASSKETPAGTYVRPSSDADTVTRDQIYTEFAPLVRHLIRKYGQDKDMQEDLVGELYVRYCALIVAFDPARGIPLRPYIVSQLSRAAHIYARHRWLLTKREAVGEAELSVAEREATVDPTLDWLAAIITEQTAALLPEALQRLPTRQRNVVIQRYYEGLSFEEIAARMAIQPATARSLLRHGLNRLRKTIGNQECF